MFEVFYPYNYVESVFSVDYKKLYDLGYRGLIFDIDNTLVHHGDDSTEEIDELFRNIQGTGLKTLLLTNNDEERVKRFIKNIDTMYICDAGKPAVDGYLKAVEMMGIKKAEAVCIGDQIFTDIYGANKSGMASILVKFIRLKEETKIGKKRQLEKVILKFYKMNKSCRNRLGDIHKKEENSQMQGNEKKLFCEMNPVFYFISEKKGVLNRHLKNLLGHEKYAAAIKENRLPNVVSEYSSNLIKKGKGIDPVLQENKAVNIKLSCSRMNGMVIHPGEVFSFWKTVGKITKRKGYRDGRVIVANKLKPSLGGGLCNLANTIHCLVLHSPLDVTEFHSHSDALAPEHGERVPFSSGTSVSYNYIDYRFKNNTDQDIQLLLWCDAEKLYGELRSEREFPVSYALVEENHHFHKEGSKYYRISKIYRNTIDKATGNIIDKKLVLDNHSEVMYDYKLIPKEMIR